MNPKVKAVIQVVFLSGILGIAAVSLFSVPGQAEIDPRIEALCPVGGGNCAADPETGYVYHHRSDEEDLESQ